MVSQTIKQIAVAVALAGAAGTVLAATATSTVTGVADVKNYTFMDLSTSTPIAIADLTFTSLKNGIDFTFNEGGNIDALRTNATSLTVYYGKNNETSSQTYDLSNEFSDRRSVTQLGENGTKFKYATLEYTYTPVTNVPEPESYAMLLAGLGLMGTIALRRNKNKAD